MTMAIYEESSDALIVSAGDRTLDGLAEFINAEHLLCQKHVLSVTEYWLRIGDALQQVHDRVGAKDLPRWVSENLRIGMGMVYFYLRAWRHREVILNTDEPITSIAAAHELMRGLKSANSRGPSPIPDYLIERARELRAQGETYQAIADDVGVSATCVRLWVNPAARKRHIRMIAERKRRLRQDALMIQEEKRRREEQERKRAERELARRVGGSVGRAYELCVTLESELNRSYREIEEAGCAPGARAEIDAALRARNLMYDNINAVLGYLHGAGR